MPQRSWLAKVKNVRELGAWCVTEADELCEEQGGRDTLTIFRKIVDHYAKGMPVAPEHRHLFHGALHDSWIVEEARDEDYRLRVACVWAHECELLLRRLLGQEPQPVRYYCDIVFRRAHLVRWAKADRSGGLALWRPEWGDETILGDWFFAEHGRVQWIVHVAAQRYGMIDCEEVTAVDHRERIFGEVWGEAGAKSHACGRR